MVESQSTCTFKSHLRFIYFSFGFIFVIHIEELINLTIGDFSLDVSGTGNALRVCLLVCLFMVLSLVLTSKTFFVSNLKELFCEFQMLKSDKTFSNNSKKHVYLPFMTASNLWHIISNCSLQKSFGTAP